MSRNGCSPSPARRTRGPRPPAAARTSTTTGSSPLAVPLARSSSSSPDRSRLKPWSGIVPPLPMTASVGPQPRPQLAQHVLGHGGQVVLRLPAPLLPRRRVVERVGPGVGDRLAHRVDLVVDPELGD